MSHSLQKHLRDAWSIYNPGVGEYITMIPPQMRTEESWYAGTADAVFQNLYLLRRSGAERVLILSGDHIYRMDYAAMLQFHCDTEADATVACMKVPLAEATSFGVMSVAEDGRVTAFHEKPAQPRPVPGSADHALASMGIYVFSCELLCHVLEEDARPHDSSHDFGKDILPRLIQGGAVYGYQFGDERGRVCVDGYWRDVGTIDAYYTANMDLLDPEPPIGLYQPDWRICGVEGQSPPARAVPGPSGHSAQIDNAILGAGAVVAGGVVRNSILSQDVRVGELAVVSDSIIFDDVVIEPGAQLQRCIVDKHVKVPAGTRIGLDRYDDHQRFVVSEGGIVVVPRDYCFGSATLPAKPGRLFDPPKSMATGSP